MSPTTIRVEPLSDRFERGLGSGSAGVGVLTDPGLDEARAPDLIEPIVGFRNWRIFADGELSSPYFPVRWSERVLRAECRRFRSAEDLLSVSHATPDPSCGCGIRAYHTPTAEFSKVDFRGVSGIVTVWGRIEFDRDGMRAENAQVEALALYSRWTRRHRQAVMDVAHDLEVDVVDLSDLEAAAAAYGATLPASLLADERTTGVRERFAALLGSRVGE
jgi:hypothetical protein